MAKIKELRELDDNELVQRLEESKRELFNLRFQLATGRLDNVTRISTVRREIAQVRTLQTERSTVGSAVKEQ
jgi:large subunit ribosomal protein L29